MDFQFIKAFGLPDFIVSQLREAPRIDTIKDILFTVTFSI